MALIVARYIPGGRTAVVMAMGVTRYPVKRFFWFDLLAALSWGLYCSLVGYLGGQAFEDDPEKGMVVGFGLVLIVALVVEAVRHVGERRSRSISSTSTVHLPGDGPTAP